MILNLKDSVVFNVHPELAVAIGWIKSEWEATGFGEFTITSAKDGTHEAHSQHKQNESIEVLGEAIDIRTRHLWNETTDLHEQRLIDFATKLQANGFRVIVHRDWMRQLDVPPHLHVGLGMSSLFKRVP